MMLPIRHEDRAVATIRYDQKVFECRYDATWQNAEDLFPANALSTSLKPKSWNWAASLRRQPRPDKERLLALPGD